MISSAGVLTFAEGAQLSRHQPAARSGTSPTYSVTVVATDSSNATARQRHVTVEVTNVDEDGTLTLSNRQPVDGVELTAELTDIDGATSDPDLEVGKVHEPDVGLDRHRRSRG